MVKQPTFDRKSPDKYIELCNIEIEVKNILKTSSYSIQESEKVPLYELVMCKIHSNLNDTEHETCRDV